MPNVSAKKNAELFEGKCRQCHKNARKIDGKCACQPRFYSNKTRCQECNLHDGLSCPASNTKPSTWFVQPGWWFQEGFTEMPRPCWRSGICVYNADFPQVSFRVRLEGDFPPNVKLEKLTLGHKTVEPAIENQRNQQHGPGELVFALDTSGVPAAHQAYSLDVSFSEKVVLKHVSVELDFDHCASDSDAHSQGSQKLCWHRISYFLGQSVFGFAV